MQYLHRYVIKNQNNEVQTSIWYNNDKVDLKTMEERANFLNNNKDVKSWHVEYKEVI